MADENQVNIVIKSKYEGKGDVDAKKGLEKVQKQAEKTNESMETGAKNVSNALVGISAGINTVKAAWGAVRGIVGWFMESIEMANKNARSVNMLAAAYNAVGFSAKGALDQAKAFATEMQNLTGIADEVFLDGQRLLANYGIVGQKAQESIRAAYALSVGIGTSLESAITLVAKAAAGSTASLSRYGIVLGDGVKEGEKFDAVLKQINDKFGASAQATMGDMATQVGALKQSWGDLREELGNYLIPAFSELIGVARQAVDVLDNMFGRKRTTDQIAYQKNLEKIAEINKQIDYWRSKVYNKGYNQKAVNDRLYSLEKELKFYTQAQEALDKQNYEKAQQAKIENEIVSQQAEQINKQKTLKQQAEEKKETEEKITEELKRQRQVLNDAGVGPKQTTSGWDTSSYVSEKPRSLADIVTGKDLSETDNFFQTIEEQKAGLEDLYNKKLELLQQGNLDEETFNQANLELNRQYAAQLAALEDQTSKRRQQAANTMWSNLVSLQSSSNKKMAAVGKAAAVAQTTIATYQSATEAYKAMAGIPIVGPVLAVAAAAAAIAAGLNNVAQISGVQLAEGGLVKAVTGGVPAVIGEGGSDEAVLPLNDSKALQRIGGAIAEQGGASAPVQIYIQTQAVGGVEAILEQLTDASRNGVVQALEFANLNYKVGAEQQGFSV